MTTHRPLLVREKLILILICIFVLLVPRVFGATYVVNSTEERPDSDPLDRVCSASSRSPALSGKTRRAESRRATAPRRSRTQAGRLPGKRSAAWAGNCQTSDGIR